MRCWRTPAAVWAVAISLDACAPTPPELVAAAPTDSASGDASTGGEADASIGGGAGGACAGKPEATASGTGGAATQPDVDTAGLAGGGAGAAVTPGPLPSIGCSASNLPAGGLLEEGVTLRGARRVYTLAVPANPVPRSPLALVFVLHGRGGTGSGIRAQFSLEERAGNAALFVYPTALKDDGGAGLTTWDRERVDSDDVALFDALVSDIGLRYCVDNNRIFSTGESNGGHMSNVLGCLRGNVLRAIAPVIGRGPVEAVRAACTPETVAVWLANGSEDATVPTEDAESTRDFWLAANGCQTNHATTTPPPCVAYQGCAAEASVFWCLFAGGHSTPAFASDAIWRFFSSFH